MAIGLDGKFYYGTAGTQASTETKNVDEVAINMSPRVAEAVRRGKKWVAVKPTVKEASVEFKMLDIEADAFMAAVKSAFFNNTRIALYPTDKASGDGLDADYYITAFNRSEGNEEFIEYSVTAQPTDEGRDPVWQ